MTRPALLIRRPAFIDAELPDDDYLTKQIRRRIPAKLRAVASRAVPTRVWQFSPDAYDSLVALLKEWDLRVEVYSPPNASPTRPAGATRALSDRDVLGVTEAAPWPVVENAYRAMALLYHPDRAGYGETERMKRINLAYEHLQEAHRV